MVKELSIEPHNRQYLHNQLINQKSFDDYVAFFTTERGADILPYVYLDSSHLYDELLENNEHYYLFNDEVSLIQNNSLQISKHLSGVEELIEIGPGSSRAVNNKTIPILKNAPDLKSYYAIDYSIDYLTDTCRCILNRAPKLKVFPLEVNLLQEDPIEINTKTTGPKSVMLLGSTLENFTISEKKHIIKNISSFMNSKDIFILTVDTNQDVPSLLSAYNNIHLYNLIKSALNYFAKINPHFEKYLDSFQAECSWDKSGNFIDMYFIAKHDLSFFFPNYGDIVINKGQILRGIKSRKPHEQTVIQRLEQHNFSIINTLTHSNKMKMFICQKR